MLTQMGIVKSVGVDVVTRVTLSQKELHNYEKKR